MAKENRYFSHREKNHLVVKVGPERKKGFALVIRGAANGVEVISEHILNEYYEKCSYNHFRENIKNRKGL